MKVEHDDGFRAFFLGMYPRVRRAAYLLCGDHYRAEDLAQITMMKVHRVWGRLDGPIDRYVRRALTNAYLSGQRRKWHGEIPYGEMPEGPVGGGLDGIDRVHDRDQIRRALDCLTPRQRAAVVLRHFEDRSEDETALLLGRRKGTAKSLTAQGVTRLRAAMAPDREPVQAASTSRNGAS